MNFSVDMIRLSVPVRVGEFVLFCNQYISVHPAIKEYRGHRLQDYRYNYAVDDNWICTQESDYWANERGIVSNKFWLGYQHNMEDCSGSSLKKYKMVIEFNPNKCDIRKGILCVILKTFFFDVNLIRLVSCDICCDFDGISMDSVSVDMGYKHTFVDYRANGGRTFYIGKRGSHGQVKIYDKASEMGLKDKTLTRWEVHLTFDDLYINMILGRGFQVKQSLPIVYMDGGQVKLIEDVKLRCCVMAVKDGTANLREFKRDFRDKIKQCLVDTASVVLDNSICKDLRETIITYCFEFCKELKLHID